MSLVSSGHFGTEVGAGEGGAVGLHGAAERVKAAEDPLHVLFWRKEKKERD